MKGTKSKIYSVIVISDATSSSKTFSVSAKLVRRGIIAALTFFLLFGFILFHYLTITLDKQKMRKLVREKNEDNKKIALQTTHLNDLQKQLKDMEVLSKKLMVMYGIDSNKGIPTIGEGGPVTEEAAEVEQFQLPSTMQGIPSRPPANPTPQQLVEDAKRLQRTLNHALSFVNEQYQRYAATPSIAPTKGYLSSSFAYRTNPFTQTREFHPGLDIATQLGSKIIAPADGTVLVTENHIGFGKTIIIDHGFGYTTRYAHLSAYNVRVGQKVKRRDVIGLTGNSGMSTAPHLHYEIQYLGKPVNPFYFILDWGKE